ncbi:alpha/beta hydrolase [Amycolatopsis mediterranei S699]|uniref:Alpha/beta hydrolase n=2 Tax=Amycolatopsis mediterranei TaxID=33910 RepID=A0A9R0UAF9_AMYMS|nr:alpha/beta fold hydrolase [Amycolatopsis mediterranei]ADJ46900.1 putative alpha/beta hydrolase [Amycolatopsis mediterranei U32]AEK43708.1 alpha/beta hydrolase [Amycolatopsis mediterranei S699]AFO78611.1 alpha/beta hydrolase [Amycolatopsis mediterranei S699]AGT85739.1 alpha/beta hydrolase [Amycolatopsis mediterranei RB]KDO04667.1 alpha/beta hydrolase [Amycolatopsis mediterranei]
MTKCSETLGQEHRVRLAAGEVRYCERGTGAPVVFVHGVLTNAELWRKVVPDVAAAGFRCLAPDLPLGSHDLPMRAGADLSPAGNADVIADFLDALDLRDVTLVANDTGGALTQILLSRRPERVGRVVLTPSDCFEYFFPPIFKALPPLARIPGSMAVLGQLLRIRALYPLPVLFGWVVKRPLPDAVAQAYLSPLRKSAGVRRDLRKLLREVHPRHTLAAAEALRTLDRPVLLAWAPEDKLFPIRLAHRLAALLPDAKLVEVPDSYTFLSEDQPAVLARHVVEFAGAMAD